MYAVGMVVYPVLVQKIDHPALQKRFFQPIP